MSSDRALDTAERAFRQTEKKTEAAQAWRDLEARNARILANTIRLRELRIARDERARVRKSSKFVVSRARSPWKSAQYARSLDLTRAGLPYHSFDIRFS